MQEEDTQDTKKGHTLTKIIETWAKAMDEHLLPPFMVQLHLLHHHHQPLPAQVDHQRLVVGCGLKHLKSGNGRIPRQQLRECHLTWLHHHYLIMLANQTQILIIMTKDLPTLDG